MKNRTIMQMFEWYLPDDGKHWERISKEAKNLAKDGVNMVWLPPAYKGAGGIHDVGYGVYDVYDLGEFDQKGTIPTKYGTKEAYLKAIRDLKKAGIEVLVDIVLNHRMGADETELIDVIEENLQNHAEDVSGAIQIEAWTKFTYPNRKKKYSDFEWNAAHFDGIDWDERGKRSGIFRIAGKSWETDVDDEYGNYDYLMGADIDLEDKEVQRELDHFGKWYLDLTQADGFRLDAVKHMNAGFYRDWIGSMRAYAKRELFSVGEYWNGDLCRLKNYISRSDGVMSLFDVPLHFKFSRISNANGSFDMATLLDGTLVKEDSWHAVTFVDNHDTQPGESLSSFVSSWLKPIAYGIILLQEKGIPCVFYGDYYGLPHDGIEPVALLPLLMRLRMTHAYGTEHDYYDHCDIVGFTREGEDKKNGLALIVSDGPGGYKKMYVGTEHRGQIYTDACGICQEDIQIDAEGYGEFRTEGGSISVWIPKES